MTAFKKSCNITYAGITYELGLDKLLKTAEQMGFNDNFRFRDIILYESSLPEDTTEVSELVWSGVGQGRVLVTPLHMCMIAGSVANGGNMMEPQLIDAITGVGGIERFRTSTGVYRRAMSEETAQVIKRYMAETVLSGHGHRGPDRGLHRLRQDRLGRDQRRQERGDQRLVCGLYRR